FVTYDVNVMSPAMQELVELCTKAALVLKAVIPALRKKEYGKFAPARLEIVALEKQGDAVYRREMAALFKDVQVDAKELLRQRAVLQALEEALDSCQDAADVLEKVAIKHG